MKTRSSSELLLVESAPGSLRPLADLGSRLHAGAVTVGADARALAQALAASDAATTAAVCIDARASFATALAVARTVRQHAAHAATPLVFVTGRDSGGFPLEAAAALGMVDLLADPALPGYADVKLAALVERARRGAEPSEEALRETEERLRLATEASGLGVWLWDPRSDRAVWENERPFEIFGLDPASEPPSAERLLAEFIHPADAGHVLRQIESAVRTRSGLQLSCRIHRRSDGALRWIELTAWPRTMRDGRLCLLGTLADITGRRQAEVALRSSEELYRTVIASMDEGFCLIEVLFDDGGAPCDYRFLEVNAAFEHHTGLRQAVGRRARELVPEHEPHWWQAYGRVAQTGEPVRFVNEAQGLARWFDVYATRLGGDGSREVAVLFNDITDRRRAEEELHRLAEARARSDRRKSEFLATLAHELRNPLAPLRNGLRLLRIAADRRPEVAERTLAVMERQLAHMVQLVDDLLDVARISIGKLDLRLQRVELQAVVDSALEACGPQIEARRQALGLDLPSVPLWLRADPVRLSQVLSNLLHNASKYTPDGGHIGLSAAPDGDAEVRISVRDDGAGIAPELLPLVFDMFTQGGRSADSLYGGLGIGLALVRRLVEQHGGTVAAESAGAGRGSTFHVRLPLAGAAPPAASPDAPPAPPAAARPLRVLVADDNADSAETLALLLQTEGHELRTAHDGAEALRLARAWRPEVAILDLGMPGLNGHEVAEALRSTPGLEGITLLALTGWGSAEDRARSAASGFDLHLTKPVDPLQVLRLLARLRPGVAAPAAGA